MKEIFSNVILELGLEHSLILKLDLDDIGEKLNAIVDKHKPYSEEIKIILLVGKLHLFGRSMEIRSGKQEGE